VSSQLYAPNALSPGERVPNTPWTVGLHKQALLITIMQSSITYLQEVSED